MTVYDTKPGSHTTINLLDTASKQTDGQGCSTKIFGIMKDDK